VPPVLAELAYRADRFEPSVDWPATAAEAAPRYAVPRPARPEGSEA
jgi:hypothetical protein